MLPYTSIIEVTTGTGYIGTISNEEAMMRRFEGLRRWEQAMEDIEDPRGSELRQLRDRVSALEEQLSGPAALGKSHAR